MSDMQDNETLHASFNDLGLNDWLVKQCSVMGFKRPTPVQYHCIPQILEGRDCIGCAKAGSGKTAAFALPILQSLCEDPYGVFALILTPTRELAIQIAEQFRVLGKPIGLTETVVVGGMNMMLQGHELAQRPHVVIATPGRLADHIETSGISFKKIKFLVLDEADRLLSEGNFSDQLKTVIASVAPKRQTLLFSATMTDALEQLKRVAMFKPFFWQSKAITETITVDQLEQKYVLMPGKVKEGYLVHVVQKFREEQGDGSIIIFCNTCRQCQLLGLMLRKLSFPAVSLHSMITQRERMETLGKFKSSIVRILVATDVASRGLDIPSVELVINYDVPTMPINYVHRVGRTARAGCGGCAVTMVTQYDIKILHAIEDVINSKLTEYRLKEDEILKILTEVAIAKGEAEIRMDDTEFGERKETNKRKQMILNGKHPDLEKNLEKKKTKLTKLKKISERQRHHEKLKMRQRKEYGNF